MTKVRSVKTISILSNIEAPKKGVKTGYLYSSGITVLSEVVSVKHKLLSHS
jgi:hypothetical protein